MRFECWKGGVNACVCVYEERIEEKKESLSPEKPKVPN